MLGYIAVILVLVILIIYIARGREEPFLAVTGRRFIPYKGDDLLYPYTAGKMYKAPDCKYPSNPWLCEVNGVGPKFGLCESRAPNSYRGTYKGVNGDAVIYATGHCGCDDCKTGAVGLGPNSDSRILPRIADKYEGEFGGQYGGECDNAKQSCANPGRSRVHSRVFSGANNMLLEPNWTIEDTRKSRYMDFIDTGLPIEGGREDPCAAECKLSPQIKTRDGGTLFESKIQCVTCE